jgi:glutamyl endopeptidase
MIVSSDGRRYPLPLEVVASAPREIGPSFGNPVLVNEIAGEAEPDGSFAGPTGDGGRHIDSVIGDDQRVKVSNTTVTPFRWIVQISVNGSPNCTGWLISGDTVMTAGHCVFDDGDWVSGISVVPARNGSSRPYGTFYPEALYSVSGWVDDSDPNYDFGAIKLSEDTGLGHMGFRATSGSLNGTLVTPVYQTYNNECCYGLAIHVRGPGRGYNEGTRINSYVYNYMIAWR